MDESEFLRGIEGEEQSGQDLVSGAEHLIRLKKQVGMTRPNDDLELDKEAGVADTLKRGVSASKNNIRAFSNGAEQSFNHQKSLGGIGLHAVSTPGKRAWGTGYASGLAIPVVAAGGIGYAAGHHSGSKEKDAGEFEECRDCGKAKTACMCGEKMASPLKSILLNARIKTAAVSSSSNDPLHDYLSSKLEESREKTANAIVNSLKDHPGLASATGLGAILGGIGTYAASRPQKDSGKSRAEEDLEGKVEVQKSQPERGLLSKMHNRNTELEHGYARAFREHPGKAALIGTVTGAMGGYGIGRLAGGLAKLRGGK